VLLRVTDTRLQPQILIRLPFIPRVRLLVVTPVPLKVTPRGPMVLDRVLIAEQPAHLVSFQLLISFSRLATLGRVVISSTNPDNSGGNNPVDSRTTVTTRAAQSASSCTSSTVAE
jgi:hypothetical protein